MLSAKLSIAHFFAVAAETGNAPASAANSLQSLTALVDEIVLLQIKFVAFFPTLFLMLSQGDCWQQDAFCTEHDGD